MLAQPKCNCACNKRTNLTPHVDYIALVIMFLGFKFLDDRIMWALAVIFIVHHTMIRIAESRA